MSDTEGANSPAEYDRHFRDERIDTVSEDSEVDFDDERDDDQLPLDTIEAAEVGVLLDDPEREDLSE